MAGALHELDATALAAAIRAGEASSLEAVRALHERIASVGAAVNGVVALASDAEERARAADAALARGEAVGPLHGVPFTAKDTLDTAGLRTTRGSLLFADHVPGEDATAVARLREAGGILLGKTNTPEFALWWETDNRVYGRTLNPWDGTRTSAGSSGGEAAALAARLTPLGLGSDLGGSIRIPAGTCGVVGLKPTHGLVPLTGHFPEAILRFMHVGPMARTVRDAALALSLLAGPDGRDWHCVPAPRPSADLAPAFPLRIAILDAFGPTEPEVTAAVAAAGEALAARGHRVEQVDAPWLASRDCNLLTIRLYGAEGGGFFGPLVTGREDDLHWFLQRRLGLPRATLDEYLAAEADVEALRQGITGLLREHDAILCPVCPAPAQPHDQEQLVIGGEALPPRTIMRATIPFDLTGSPAIAVPWALGEAGLPIGVQVVGRRFEDELVLRLALAVEADADPRVLAGPSL
ncbi:MAG: amidase [Thermoleophilia bacterium]